MLIDDFYAQLKDIVEEDGELDRFRGMALGNDGVTQEHVLLIEYKALASNFWQLVEDCQEVIFAIDIVTRDGQGTLYGDALILICWKLDPENPESKELRIGVVNYEPGEPLIFEEIDWDNAFWTTEMKKKWRYKAAVQA